MVLDVSSGNTAAHCNLTKGSFIFLAFACLAFQRSTDIGDREIENLTNILINYFKLSDSVNGTYALTLLGELKFLVNNQPLLLDLEWYVYRTIRLDDLITCLIDPFEKGRVRLA